MIMKTKLLMLCVLPMLLLCSCNTKQKANVSSNENENGGLVIRNYEVIANEEEPEIEEEIVYNYIYIEFGNRNEYYHISSWKRYETGNDFVDLEITLAVSKKSYRWYKQGMYYVLMDQYDIKYNYNGLIE